MRPFKPLFLWSLFLVYSMVGFCSPQLPLGRDYVTGEMWKSKPPFRTPVEPLSRFAELVLKPLSSGFAFAGDFFYLTQSAFWDILGFLFVLFLGLPY